MQHELQTPPPQFTESRKRREGGIAQLQEWRSGRSLKPTNSIELPSPEADARWVDAGPGGGSSRDRESAMERFL